MWIKEAVESRRVAFDAATQPFCEGENVGTSYSLLQAACGRYFGGTPNYWGGHCRPFDDIDFERVTRLQGRPLSVTQARLCALLALFILEATRIQLV